MWTERKLGLKTGSEPVCKGLGFRWSGLLITARQASQGQGQPRGGSQQAGIRVIAKIRINRQESGQNQARDRRSGVVTRLK